MIKNDSSYSGAVFNGPRGLFDIQCGQVLSGAICYQCEVPVFDNTGLLRKSAEANTSMIHAVFLNKGSVEALTGGLDFLATYVQSDGLLLLNGGNLAARHLLDIRGGALHGYGIINASVANHGTVHPSPALGELAITGDYTRESDGVLSVELEPQIAGTNCSRLVVGGMASLAGVLNATLGAGFIPEMGSAFAVFGYTTHSGQFDAVQLPALPWGRAWTQTYASMDFLLGVTNPNRIGSLTLTEDGRFQGALQDPPGSLAVLEASSDFLNWVPVCTNQPFTGVFRFDDDVARSGRNRFYRARIEP